MKTPVLFLIFNRRQTALRVFERIRKIQPKELFIAADGPRAHKQDESELCHKIRREILSMIDWPCEVKTLFRTKNMGCKLAISSAIDWFFEHVEEGIILEDDCLPDPSFFPFCEELLERYRHNDNIMMISGDNFQPAPIGTESYFFSRFTHIWGWATWKRAWNHYDLTMSLWPELKSAKQLEKIFPSTTVRQLEKMFDVCFDGTTTTWDAQWLFACLQTQGLSIYPNTNLVSNIEPTGTHMKPYDPCTLLPTVPMQFPLKHPQHIQPNVKADTYTQSDILFRSPLKIAQLIVRHLIAKETEDTFFLKLRKIIIAIMPELKKRFNRLS